MKELLKDINCFLQYIEVHQESEDHKRKLVAIDITVVVDLRARVAAKQKVVQEETTKIDDRMIKLNNAMAYWQNSYFGMFAQHQAVLKEVDGLRKMITAEKAKVKMN